MENKYGLRKSKFYELEKKIVNLKLNILDEEFNFNEETLGFKHLVKLNDFLFGDLYDGVSCRDLSDDEIKFIEKKLRVINKLCLLDEKPIEEILNLLLDIWEMQPFLDGNTRTIIGYLKVLNCGYLLGLDINTNGDIKSDPKIFRLNEGIVNQKRLTKNK